MAIVTSLRNAITAAGGTPTQFTTVGLLRELVTAYGGTPTQFTTIGLLREAITAKGGTPTGFDTVTLMRQLVTLLGGVATSFDDEALAVQLSTVAQTIGPDTSVSTAWAGDVTQTTFTAAHTTAADTQGTRLVASTDPTFATGKIYSAYRDTATKTVQHTVSGLTADTAYYFCIEVNGTLKTTKSGSFKTMAASNSFRFAFGCCQSGSANGKILDQIRTLATKPRFFIHLGDLHYDDIGTVAPTNGVSYVPQFDASIDLVQAGTYSGPFLRQMPIYYMFDDHDFGPNDSDSTSPSRADSISVFRRRAPNPAGAFSGATEPVCYSFVQGRIRFIMADMRSQKATSTVLGAAQKQWFKDQIDAAYAAGQFLCWVHSTPYILRAGESTDSWSTARIPEREEISDYLVSSGMSKRTFIISGDNHIVAADDGLDTDYAVGGGAKLPLIHAAPLYAGSGREGTGGPYNQGRLTGSASSTGALTKESEAGYVDVTDDGTTVTMAFTAIGMDQSESSPTTFLNYSFQLPYPTIAPPTGVTLVQEYHKRFENTTGTYSSTLRAAPTQGNLLIMHAAFYSGITGAVPTPSGWTKIGSDSTATSDGTTKVIQTATFYKIAGASESATITLSTGQRYAGTSIIEVSGVDSAAPIDQQAATIIDNGSTANTISVAVTPVSANEWALFFTHVQNGQNVNGARSTGGGFTERHTITQNLPGYFVASKQLAAAGVAHTASFTYTGTADEMIGRVITIKPTPPAPANTVAPAVTGTTTTGSVLTSTTGTWSNSPTAYAYQWKRNGTNIAAATSSTYTLVVADEGTSVLCAVTASNSGGSATANSNTVSPTAAPASPAILQEDGTSYLLQEAGTSKYLQE